MPKAYVFTRYGGPETEAITAGAPAEEVERLGGARVARARDTAVQRAVADLVVRGELNPQVTLTFPRERAGEALREVESGHARGKVVLEIGADG
ncbi:MULTISPECIES: zinc-binding dehydrogenase [Streptomyces]|uniref:zinc-binding dehydrogenase n=1 Tax=Streptomyces TaxID=1883 RepID=UPI003556AE7F